MAHKEKDIVWYGMKVSPKEKEMIKKRAEHYKTSPQEVIMGLLEDSVADLVPRISGKPQPDILKYAGVFEGSETLSTNKTYHEGHGRSSLS